MSTDVPLASTLRAMALGRIGLGAASLVAPTWLARTFRIRSSPELRYMTRIYGARAIALGVGYLTAPPAERPRWQRLGLMVDGSDTASGLAHLARRDLPRPAALSISALTGSYAALGASRLVRDLR